ncbi:hypothetical protein FNT36_18885 [Hymenobacter setariae]|uniref:DUF5672 domain-containing protein n=1 Tax=Hymenobacter setariae TaxID=2594794 RepID=A0A558BP24_9BACT|nr:DUF5672 family protein [Hymenobacter setariae]TVT38266.1 hypothetical protein FNT36_18885 [Hymenobacter setariae]
MAHKKIYNKVVVVIPIHTPNPSAYELISFEQCFKILGNYPIKVLAPEGLSLVNYQKIVVNFDTIFIAPKWQSNVQQYNKLKTSRFFYNIFENYDFMLTYELDAFVFRDDLMYWCDKNYDYVGAPWFENYIEAGPNDKIIGVGNSGFSLRKITTVRKVLSNIYYKNPLEYGGSRFSLLKAYLKAPVRWLLNQIGENYTVQKNFHYNEDVFFSEVAPLYEKSFTVSPIEDAIQFSFETNPEVLFNINNKVLPMGCHAWWRYNLDFWRPYISAFGYKL